MKPATEPTRLLERRSLARHAWDLCGIPFRLALFPDAWNRRLGWSSLEEERLRAVLPHIRGRLLDIGAGTNSLARMYGSGAIGVDVHDHGGGALIVEDTRKLPFPDGSFDTVTFLACLNHIPYRREALLEARRLLVPGGQVLLTMISRLVGWVGHKIWWYSEEKHRPMDEAEEWGLDHREILTLVREAGFQVAHHATFVYRMNHLYCCRVDPITVPVQASEDTARTSSP